ncbi:ABC transporter permease [Candidatus Woesearchaeota archaeon]|nr:ABC transporter permease [Candidatus Woesearchaeota archaeon]
MIKDYLLLAFRNLSRRRLRSWLTMIGVFIGIAAVVSLISLGEGLRNAVMSQFSVLGPDMITVQAGGVQFGPPGTGVTKPLDKDLVPRLNNIPGVHFAIGRLLKSGKISFNDRTEAAIAGSLPDGEYRKEIERIASLKAEQGRLLEDGDRFKVVVGHNYQKEDTFGRPTRVGDRIVFNGYEFEVVGVAAKVGSFFLDGALFINEDVLREVFDTKDEVSAIAVKVESGQNMQLVKENIEKIMRKERNVKEGEEDFRVELAAETLKTLDSTLFAVQLFVYIIAAISLLVGGIGITNTMFTSVLERTKEIGILKAIGARNGDIFTLFFIESGMLGLVGGIIGVTLGMTLAKGFAFVGAQQLSTDLIQANISIVLVFGSLAFSFIIGCVAGLIPALRASRLPPVECLRYAK